jgi:hypothetical protein
VGKLGEMRRQSLPLLLVASSVWALACGSDPLGPPEERRPGGEQPGDEPSAEVLAVAAAIGKGDGSAGSVEFVRLYGPSDHPSGHDYEPTALAFNSARPHELWVTLRDHFVSTPCTEAAQSECRWLWGWVAIIEDPGTSTPSARVERDENAWHFMRRPSSIAFGDADLFATCGEARTSNFEDQPAPFNGPVLWSSDPAIFGVPAAADSPTSSTHIDMMHSSPYCMGIAHERDNVYWTFNGDAGSLDRYDFRVPHAPGLDDHSDGEILRYATGLLSRVTNVPSHLAYERETDMLYAVDTGQARLIRLDTKTGTRGADIPQYDGIKVHSRMDGAVLTELVPPGVFERPSGLTLHRGVLFVTDPALGLIFAFDRAGRLLRTLDTGFEDGALGGIVIGPDQKAYITNITSGEVLRIEPS